MLYPFIFKFEPSHDKLVIIICYTLFMLKIALYGSLVIYLLYNGTCTQFWACGKHVPGLLDLPSLYVIVLVK